jgi:hypothetical protein
MQAVSGAQPRKAAQRGSLLQQLPVILCEPLKKSLQNKIMHHTFYQNRLLFSEYPAATPLTTPTET